MVLQDSSALELYLADERIPASVVNEIKRRISNVCDSWGFFPTTRLNQVIGAESLAARYKRAAERSHRYR